MDIRDLFPDLRGTKFAPKRTDNRESSHTKAGPGRKHIQGKPDADRVVRPAGVHFGQYGRGLQNHFDRRGAKRQRTV